jgi:hypothetical protein
MTLIIRKNADGSGEVQHTDTTEAAVGGRVNIHGSFKNTGKVKVFRDGRLEVDKDFLNDGELFINDPEKIKQIIIEALKTTSTLSDLGIKILEKLNLLQ